MPDEYDEATETDALLSALIDGELDPQAESDLRERIAREPALAERLALLGRVDPALRSLPTPELSSDLAARMRAKIAEQTRQPRPSQPGASTGTTAPPRSPRSAPPRRTRRAWPAAAGLAAVAAALAFYLLLPATTPESSIPRLEPRSEPRLEAQAPSNAVQPTLLASAGADELGIALYYDELVDLEMLEQLELLELLVAIEEAEQS